MISFRLGGTDGVSIEAAKWCAALRTLGFGVRTIAGEGVADVLVPGLGRSPSTLLPSRPLLAEAVEGVDVVVVENLVSLPLNPTAADAVAALLRGRPAVMRHHDLAWQRPQFATLGYEVPDDPQWAHVVLNSASRRELAERDIASTVLHNRFPLDGWTRCLREAKDGDRVLLHPVRAIPRKEVATAVHLAEALGATYWLTGPAEDGYDATLEEILSAARCDVRRDRAESMAAAYAAADAVAFPSSLEGFGNPVIESAMARRPLAVGRYPVLVEDLAPFGFRWFDPSDPTALGGFLAEPDVALLDRNEEIARSQFGLDRLPGELASVLERVL